MVANIIGNVTTVELLLIIIIIASHVRYPLGHGAYSQPYSREYAMWYGPVQAQVVGEVQLLVVIFDHVQPRTQKFSWGFHSVACGGHLYLVCGVCDVTI